MATTDIKRIVISLEMRSKKFSNMLATTRERFQRIDTPMRNFSNVLGMTQERYAAANKAANMFPEQLTKLKKNMPEKQMNQLNNDMGMISSRGGKTANSFRNMTHGLRGFKMEMLGVMFFGMGIQAFFTGLLQPALQMVGVFELLKLTLAVLFIPVALQLLEILMPLFNWLMNLSDGSKKLIGWFVVFGAAVGGLLFLIGMLGLGIGSLILTFGVLIPMLAPFAPYILAATTALLGLGLTFSKVMTKGPEIIERLKNWFRDLKPNIEKAGGAFNYFKEVIDKVLSKLPIIGPIYKLLSKIYKTIKDFWNSEDKYAFLRDKFVNGLEKLKVDGGIKGAVAGFVLQIYNWISGRIRSIKTFGDDIFGMIKNTPDATWKDIGVYIAKKIATGLKTYLSEMIKGIKFRPTGELVSELNLKLQQAANLPRKDDFIWRPGSGAISINPNDTLVGYKGDSPFGSGGGGTNITNNFYGFTNNELNRELDNRDRRIVNEIGRIVKQ